MMNDTNSNFALWRDVLASSNTILIEKDAYSDIAYSESVLVELSKFGEKFYIICEYYRHFEKFIFDINIDHMLYMFGDRLIMHRKGTEMSRLILCFLSSTKLYLDSSLRHAKGILIDSFSIAEIKKIAGEIFDSSYEYRVIEFIRNHTKHYDLSVKSASYGLSWYEKRLQCSFSSDFTFDVSVLGGDVSGRQATYQEIIQNGGKIDLKKSIRSYFGSMCEMHTLLRQVFAAEKFRCLATIDLYQKMWIEKNPDDWRLTGVVAGYLTNNLEDENYRKVYIDPNIEIYTDHFFKMTENLANMDKRIVKW